MKVTYETKLRDRDLYPLFDDIAALMSRIEHRLYVEVYVKHRDLGQVKKEMLVACGVTGRQFNGVQRVLAGKADGAIESKKLHRDSLNERISSARTWLKKTERRVDKLTKDIAAEERRVTHPTKRTKPPDGDAFAKAVAERKRLRTQAHHKQRYLAKLEGELVKVESDIEAGNPRLCFGSRGTFAQQGNVAANGYRSHDAWKANWDAKRAGQFLCIGSHEETSGNQTLTWSPTGEMRLRVPPALEAKYGHWLTFPAPDFRYGGDRLAEAVAADQPVTYRFLHRKNGWWYLQATIEDAPVPIVTIPELGAIGVDLNSDHVALGELDRFGNPVWTEGLAISNYGRSHAQIEASLGDVVAEVVAIAKDVGKPVVVERLDFAAKRARLRESGGHRYARMLSGFAYAKFMVLLEARCAREGVELIKVNPTYTSLIGLVKFSGGYGISSHEAAAVTIDRRGMGERKKVCKCEDKATCAHVPVPRGLSERFATKARSAPPLPGRTRGRHAWSDWNRHRKRLREEFSLGRRSQQDRSGGNSPSSRAPTSRVVPTETHGPERASQDHLAVAVLGCDSPAEVGKAVRPAAMEDSSTG